MPEWINRVGYLVSRWSFWDRESAASLSSPGNYCEYYLQQDYSTHLVFFLSVPTYKFDCSGLSMSSFQFNFTFHVV